MKIIEDFEMAANSDINAHPSFSEVTSIIGDGMCTVNRRRVNFGLYIKLTFFFLTVKFDAILKSVT